MKKLLDSLGPLLVLGALAYLGFYVYGLVMGVFSPFEMVAFTLVAVACAIVAVIHGIRIRRAMKGPDRDHITHDLQKFKEKRGF